MDQSCRDIPMRLDIKHQPLNFDIYLSQVIDIPKTSLEEPPYDFKLERDALDRVDQIIERTTKKFKDADCEEHKNFQYLMNQNTILTPTTVAHNEQCNSQTQFNSSSTSTKSSFQYPASDNQDQPTAIASTSAIIPPPSCPAETPLTPIKCFIEPTTTTSTATANGTNSTATNSNNSNQENNTDKSTVNQINPRDFEDMHYNPFDHIELQTIDELKELDLVFQASYANQTSKQ